MYLKNIEIYGFKSFAQKINLEFKDGITGIVGPNGSGKSNVADAVRWVLGEQSARQLRGQNMQDVIFSGTEARKPLSFASVAITFDNSDHILLTDYNEVTVTRRLYRSGESEYLINGSQCRLKDVHEMFYDTGIGKEGYSIIGQGQIDKILSGKPEDRRELFDEAAGIVKFKRRKMAAVKKLEEEESNLVRVTDILRELDRQIEPLKRQSETARIYLGKRDELKELDMDLFAAENSRYVGLTTEAERKYHSAKGELDDAKTAYDGAKQSYDQLELEVEEEEKQLEELRNKSTQEQTELQTIGGRVGILGEQIRSAQDKMETIRQRLASYKEEYKTREESEQSLFSDTKALKIELTGKKRQLTQFETQSESLKEKIKALETSTEESSKEIVEILEARARIQGQSERLDTLIEQSNIRRAEINKDILTLRGDESSHESDIREASEVCRKMEEQLSKLNAELGTINEDIVRIGEEIKSQTDKLEIAKISYHRESSRYESLRNMAERYDGYGNSIKRVMEQKKNYAGIRGVVADIIHVDKKYETAIETALGGSLQNIVTDDEYTAKSMIGYLKKNKYGRATFLPLSSIKARNFQRENALQEKGAVGTAETLVTCDAEYDSLARYLLGHILVVDNIDNAIAIGRKYSHSFRMVTIEGESINPGGAMTGGAFRNSGNLLGRRREMEELSTQIENLSRKIKLFETSIEGNRSNRNMKRDRVKSLETMIRDLYVEKNTADIRLQNLKNEIHDVTERHEQIKKEQEELKVKISEISTEKQSIEEQLRLSQKDEKELHEFLAAKEAEIAELKQSDEEITKSIGELRIDITDITNRLEFSEENFSRVEGELQALKDNIREAGEELSETEKELKEKTEEKQQKESKTALLEQSIQDCRTKIEELKKASDENRKKRKLLLEERDSFRERLSILEKECYRLESIREKLNENHENLITYLWDEYELTPSEALVGRDGNSLNRDQVQKQITKVKTEIRSLGSVNVNAIEEYKEISERHTFLKGQYEDLKEAKDALGKIILELDEGMRRQFSERFADIRTEFNKSFRELFGGGKGSLELDDSEDILEAGVRIISQPPGKKLQNMMQLSGGEKALTAIALLFAIQNLKPSPFCLLDEIEAALDDSNVTRFATYLQKLTKNTQFIIITHRRGTMTSADRLYGITMQEKGVSALVSVDLVENQLSN